MSAHSYPFLTLFRRYVPDLTPPDEDGWASGSCPFCGETETFRVNLKSGRWVCLPSPNLIRPPGASAEFPLAAGTSTQPHGGKP